MIAYHHLADANETLSALCCAAWIVWALAIHLSTTVDYKEWKP